MKNLINKSASLWVGYKPDLKNGGRKYFAGTHAKEHSWVRDRSLALVMDEDMANEVSPYIPRNLCLERA